MKKKCILFLMIAAMLFGSLAGCQFNEDLPEPIHQAKFDSIHPIPIEEERFTLDKEAGFYYKRFLISAADFAYDPDFQTAQDTVPILEKLVYERYYEEWNIKAASEGIEYALLRVPEDKQLFGKESLYIFQPEGIFARSPYTQQLEDVVCENVYFCKIGKSALIFYETNYGVFVLSMKYGDQDQENYFVQQRLYPAEGFCDYILALRKSLWEDSTIEFDFSPYDLPAVE